MVEALTFDHANALEDRQRLVGGADGIAITALVASAVSLAPQRSRQSERIANPSRQSFFVGIGFAVPIATAGGVAGTPPQ